MANPPSQVIETNKAPGELLTGQTSQNAMSFPQIKVISANAHFQLWTQYPDQINVLVADVAVKSFADELARRNNTHDDMTNALRLCIEAYEFTRNNEPTGHLWPDPNHIFHARNALAKANT